MQIVILVVLALIVGYLIWDRYENSQAGRLRGEYVDRLRQELIDRMQKISEERINLAVLVDDIRLENAAFAHQVCEHGENIKMSADQEIGMLNNIAALVTRADRTEASIADLTRSVKFGNGTIASGMKEMRKEYGDTLNILRELISATGENFSLRLDDISKRLIDIETESPQNPQKEDDEDPLVSASSWHSHAAAAERGQGIRD